MIYKIETTTPIESVKAELETKAKEFGFGILGVYNFQQILKNKGLILDKNIAVYEICNPIAAQEVLNNVPQISVYLPCRLSIYEENGLTVLETIGIEDMVSSLDINDKVTKYMHSIFDKVSLIMNSWSHN